MIAADTNVVLRYLLADDASQHRKARALIETKHPVLITDIVLAETVWTLTGKRYGIDKAGVCDVVRALIGDSAFQFESNQVVWSALMDYQDSKSVRGKALDFADCLIARKADLVAARYGSELEGFYSFDKAVTQLDGAKVPGAVSKVGGK